MKILLIISTFIFPTFLIAQAKSGTFKVRKQPEASIVHIAEVMPKFPGGKSAMMRYLSNNIIYPDSSKENNVTGKVYVQFVIQTDGTVNNVSVLRGVNNEIDNEAIRVINAMPKWKPGMHRGEVISAQMAIPIDFKLK
jgi:protein TonB